MPSRQTRRTLLATLGAAAAALAGCSTAPSPDDPPEPSESTAVSPDDHVYGATGEWASVGCNAANTRSVDDGQAPVDGISERWRVTVPRLGSRAEPIVADDRVYLLDPDDRLRVLDAGDGSLLWEHAGTRTPPLVRDRVYVGTGEGLLALDPAGGEELWSVPVDGPVGTPATSAGDKLYVPAGETVHALDPASGETNWSRRLFGRLLDPPAIHMGHGVVVVSEAGQLSMLSHEGTGLGRWTLPATPQAPPTTDTDGIYVNCLDGRTYGVDLENTPRQAVSWNVETGWANGGLAVREGVYAAGTLGLFAVDPETGEQRWHHDTGDWRHTAPALGRDTLFVGGDRLYALDPTPSGSLDGGPAIRFEREFHGRVGPGPVLDDGSLYVVAQTGPEAYHLLAFD